MSEWRIEIEEGADVDQCLRGVKKRDNTRLPRVILLGTRRTRLDLSGDIIGRVFIYSTSRNLYEGNFI